jgi:hypothetical protein
MVAITGAGHENGGVAMKPLSMICRSLILTLLSVALDHAQAAEQLHFADRSVWLTVVSGLGIFDTQLGDVTGDGKADVVFHENHDVNGSLQQPVSVARSTGSNFEKPVVWSTNPCPQSDGCAAFALADVNRDGKADLIAFKWGSTESPGWANVWVSLSDGTKFLPAQLWHDSFCIREQICYVADVNGDGRADLVAYTPKTGLVWVSLSQGNSFGPNSIWQNFFCILGERCFVGDVDGDGKADLILFKPNANGVEKGNVLVALSNGHGAGPVRLWHGFFCINLELCLVGDVNGDGRTDAVLLKPWNDSTQALVALSNKTQFLNAEPFNWNDRVKLESSEAFLADVTGDKRADLVIYEKNSNGNFTVAVYVTEKILPPCPPGQKRDPTTEQCKLPTCPDGQFLDLATGTCKSLPNPGGASSVDIFNCNQDMDAQGEHRAVTLYIRDLSVPGTGFSFVANLKAQYANGHCPFDENGQPSDPETINLVPNGLANNHLQEIVIVDPGLQACDGRNDPTLDNCIRQQLFFQGNQAADTVRFTVP